VSSVTAGVMSVGLLQGSVKGSNVLTLRHSLQSKGKKASSVVFVRNYFESF